MMEVGSPTAVSILGATCSSADSAGKSHTRVSGVCLFEAGLVDTESGYNWFPHTQLVINPCAQRSLPTWIHEALILARQTV